MILRVLLPNLSKKELWRVDVHNFSSSDFFVYESQRVTGVNLVRIRPGQYSGRKPNRDKGLRRNVMGIFRSSGGLKSGGVFFSHGQTFFRPFPPVEPGYTSYPVSTPRCHDWEGDRRGRFWPGKGEGTTVKVPPFSLAPTPNTYTVNDPHLTSGWEWRGWGPFWYNLGSTGTNTVPPPEYDPYSLLKRVLWRSVRMGPGCNSDSRGSSLRECGVHG